MIKLSLWAKQHPAKARAIIVLLHILLIVLAVYTGVALLQLGLHMPAALVYLAVCLFFTAAFLYPSRQKTTTCFNKRQLYAIRKSCDFIFGACSFILVCFVSGSYAGNTASITGSAAKAAFSAKDREKPTAAAILASLAYRDKSTLTRPEKRILKTEFRRQLIVYAKAKLTKDDEAGAKAAFIILSIIGAVSLTFLLAGLACSISCNGSDAGAVIVLLLGLVAIIWLLVFAIKKIKQHHKKIIEEKTGKNLKPANSAATGG